MLPATITTTQREMLSRVNQQLPKTVGVGVFGPAMMRLIAPFSKLIRETLSTRVQFDRPWLLDASGFESTYGPIELTEPDRSIEATVASWLQRPA